MLIYCFTPFIKICTFGFVLFAILSFSFNNKILSIVEFTDEIGEEPSYNTLEVVENNKIQMVILDKGIDMIRLIDCFGFKVFPRTIANNKIGMCFFKPFTRF